MAGYFNTILILIKYLKNLTLSSYSTGAAAEVKHGLRPESILETGKQITLSHLSSSENIPETFLEIVQRNRVNPQKHAYERLHKTSSSVFSFL